ASKELGVESKTVLAKLQELGEYVKSASSTVEAPVARRLRATVEQGSGATIAPAAPVASIAPAAPAPARPRSAPSEPAAKPAPPRRPSSGGAEKRSPVPGP